MCKYPKWAPDKVEKKISPTEVRKTVIVIPYAQGLGQSIKKICTKYGVQTYFKGNKTIKEILVKKQTKIL